VYVPAAVFPTKLGEPFSTQVCALVPALLTCALASPLWAVRSVRASLTVLLPVVQAFVLLSNPELLIRLAWEITCLLAMDDRLARSLTVSVRVKVPVLVYRCVAVDAVVVRAVVPSPQLYV